MTSLLRTEAAERAATITVTSMEVTLNLAWDDCDHFYSRTVIYFDANTDHTFVDFKGQMSYADLNGRLLPDDAWHDGRIELTGLEPRNRLTVKGLMAFSHDGEGLCQHIDPVDGREYLYAMSFLDAAPRWFACFDQPDMKAPYSFDVVVPVGWGVYGNGAFHTVDEQVEKGQLWIMEQTPPLATYFVTLVAGPYAKVEMNDGIPLTLLARQSLAAELEREADDILAVTKASFDAYHELFGVRYPFGAYTQAFVPDFNAGAMENPGCVTFRDSYLLRGRPTRMERSKRATTIAHEMAHQWFGDLVTMRWWDDLWLNESFAEYMGNRVVSKHTQYDTWTAFGIVRQDWGAVADQRPSTHPVAGNGADDAQGALASFDGISYAKGASLLRQLATSLGDDIFLGGLRAYFDAHRFGNATLADLMDAWRAAGATDIDAFAIEWLRTSGMDLAEVSDDGRSLAVSLGRCGITEPMVSGVTVDVAALGRDGEELARTTLRDVMPMRHGPVKLPIPPAGTVTVVPDAGAAAWWGRRPSSWSLPPIASIGDAGTRVVLHNAIRGAVRWGELAVPDALRLVLDGLPGEASDEIVVSMLGFAVDLAGMWSPWDMRVARLADVAGLISAMLQQAEPQDDRALLLNKALVRCTSDVAWLRDLLGTESDPDLRWAAVTRLVALGEDVGVVDDELARDPQGVDKAAGARVAAPTSEAKQMAMDALLQASDRRAYELYAIADNVWQVGQETLSAPFVERWFAGIGATAGFRDGWALAQVARRSFPVLVAAPETLALAEQTLAATTDDRLHRELSDGTDLLGRVMHSPGR